MTEPRWRVKARRGGEWRYVIDGERVTNELFPRGEPPPHDFGRLYNARYAAIREIMAGAEAIEIETVSAHEHENDTTNPEK